jgi:hypothetical protein
MAVLISIIFGACFLGAYEYPAPNNIEFALIKIPVLKVTSDSNATFNAYVDEQFIRLEELSRRIEDRYEGVVGAHSMAKKSKTGKFLMRRMAGYFYSYDQIAAYSNGLVAIEKAMTDIQNLLEKEQEAISVEMRIDRERLPVNSNSAHSAGVKQEKTN